MRNFIDNILPTAGGITIGILTMLAWILPQLSWMTAGKMILAIILIVAFTGMAYEWKHKEVKA